MHECICDRVVYKVRIVLKSYKKYLYKCVVKTEYSVRDRPLNLFSGIHLQMRTVVNVNGSIVIFLLSYYKKIGEIL